jgi:hypothetical protein
LLRQDDYVRSQLVSYGWRFGQSYGGGHLAGQMVMQVIANRVRAGWGSWLRMLDCVPDYMAENVLPELVHPSVWEPTFVRLLAAVEGIYDGSVQDMTRGNEFSNQGKIKSGALYFCALNKVERPWFKNAILEATNPITGLKVHEKVWNMNNLAGFD